MYKYCPRCGKKLDENNNFCSNCGHSIIQYNNQNNQKTHKEKPKTQENKTSNEIPEDRKNKYSLKTIAKYVGVLLSTIILSLFALVILSLIFPILPIAIVLSICLVIIFYQFYIRLDYSISSSPYKAKRKTKDEKTTDENVDTQKYSEQIPKYESKNNESFFTEKKSESKGKTSSTSKEIMNLYKTKKPIFLIGLFFILIILFLAVDADGDGLNSITEIQEGTKLFEKDSDRDGLTDGEEINEYRTNPLDDDCDSDYLLDGEEINDYETSPTKDDSDDDGLNDYDELFTHETNPLNSDSDDDGLADYDEINEYGTSPNEEDHDGDGLLDGEEINKGTDFFNFDTDGDGIKDGNDDNPTTHDWKLIDTDNDGLNDYEEYYSYGTDRFISDTDGDGAPDGYDAHPKSTAKKTRKYYEWEYDGSIWSWEIYVSYDLYTYEAELERIENWGRWSEYTLDPTAKQLANGLEDAADENDFNYYQTVNFVLGFVQSLAYTEDDITSGYDEYPRYPLETLYEDGGDCEDTSILFSSILKEMNIDNRLALLSEAGHAMVAVWGDDDYSGSSWSKNGKKYFCCETTGEGFEMGDQPSLSSTSAILYGVGVINPIEPPSNQPPDISVYANPTSGNAPLTVSFTCNAEDIDGYVASYDWDFKDGSFSTKQNPSHTFDDEGIYTVTISVTDNQGYTNTNEVTIEVLEPTYYSLTPTDDVHVVNVFPNENQNDFSFIKVRKSIWDVIQISYLMFDLTDIPSDIDVKSSILNLETLDVSEPCTVSIYKCYDVSWDENTLNWNNRPLISSENPVDSIFIDSEGTKSFDVTPYLISRLNYDKITFILKTENDEGNVAFYSKPELYIELV